MKRTNPYYEVIVVVVAVVVVAVVVVEHHLFLINSPNRACSMGFWLVDKAGGSIAADSRLERSREE